MTVADRLALRRRLLNNGWLPLPLAGKACYVPGWSQVDIDDAFLVEHARKSRWGNTGIRTGSVVAIDIDVDDADLAATCERLTTEHLGRTAFCRFGAGEKRLLVYWCDTPPRRMRTAKYVRDDVPYMVEVLGKGSQFAAYGTHPSGVAYEWAESEPATVLIDELPALRVEQLEPLLEAITAEFEAAGLAAAAPAMGAGDADHDYCLTADMRFEVIAPPHGLLTVSEIRQQIQPGEAWVCNLTGIRQNSDSEAGRIHVGPSGRLSIADFVTGLVYYEVAALDDREALAQLPAPPADGGLFNNPNVPNIPRDPLPAALRDLMARYCYVWDGSVRPIDDPTQAYRWDAWGRAHNQPIPDPATGRLKATATIWLGLCRQAHYTALLPNEPSRFIDRPAGDGVATVLNLYTAPQHTTTGGSTTIFMDFMAHLLPDRRERALFLAWLAHKIASPGDRMHAMVLVAHGVFGTGRGTLVQIIEKLIGEQYCTETTLSHLTGATTQSQYTEYLSQSLFVSIPEAWDAGHAQGNPGARKAGKWAARKAAYEALKQVADTASRRMLVVRKGVANTSESVHATLLVCTNHADALAIERGDRRLVVLDNGSTPLAGTDVGNRIHAWARDPDNIGALYRWLLSHAHASRKEYDPFGLPPETPAKHAMIQSGLSGLDRAWELFVVNAPEDVTTVEEWSAYALRVRREHGLEYPDPEFIDGALRAVMQRNGRRPFPDNPTWQCRVGINRVRPWVVRNWTEWRTLSDAERGERCRRLLKDSTPPANVLPLSARR